MQGRYPVNAVLWERMLLVNLTFKRFPAHTADAHYVRELSKGFGRVLGEDFLLVAANDTSNELHEIPHRIIGFRRKSGRPLYYFFYIPFLFFALRRHSRERIVFFSNDHFLLASLLLWRKTFFFSYRVCADWHMLVENWKDSFVAHHADLHITTSNHLREKLTQELGINPAKVYTVYGGVGESVVSKAVSKIMSRKELGLPENKTLVGYVGFFKTLGMEKGIGTMIDSLTYLEQAKDIVMVFVGGLPNEIEQYQNKAREAGVLDRCLFVERVPSERTAIYEQAMDILTIPYPDEPHFRNYGFPMKTWEYMASGIPIIYSNLPIIDEVLHEYGFPFTPGDAHSLAKTVQSVLMDNEEVAKRVGGAKQRAHDLTWDKKAKMICAKVEENICTTSYIK